MRISGTGASGNVTRLAGARRSEAAGGGFKIGSGEEAAAAGGVEAASGLASVNPLLILQELPDPTAGRRRAFRRAGGLLDQLERVRIALLEGAMPRSQIERLVALIETTRAQSGDAATEALLDEVDLRARVELAKLERAGAA